MKLGKDTIISHYKILSAIGRGGMGEVYLAEDTKLDRKVAIKFLSKRLSRNSKQLERFVREAKAASALNHPNIVTIHEIGEADGARFIALEYIDGETLNRYLSEPRRLDDIIGIAVQIASALDAAHSAGIVHRDIKPENIMIRRDGIAKILDFGIAKAISEFGFGNSDLNKESETMIQDAETNPRSQIPNPKLTMPGMVIGTASYMSPEQAKGKETDARTDIFSLGVVLYEMLAGRLPFEGETPMETIAAIITKEPEDFDRPGAPPELKAIIRKTLEKDRGKRYRTSRELLDALEHLRRRLEFEAEFGRAAPKGEAPTRMFASAEGMFPTQLMEDRNSIAVMPFEHLSSAEDDEYFCEGLAEELMNALAKIENLEVAARSSSFSFKGRGATVREIGEALNVRSVLEGSVRKSGNRLRISVQLLNTADGYQIWSERYDRELNDIFEVQDEIALSVVEELKVKLLGGEREAVLKRYTENAGAYQFYLKGRYFFARRTADGFSRAIECYRQAIELDERYALAYSGMADCHTFLGYYELISPAEALKHSEHFALKGLELDDGLAETHTSNAIRNLLAWNLAESLEGYDRALAINPRYSAAHHFRSLTLAFLGRGDEAIAAERRAIALEPFMAIYNAALGQYFYLAGHYDEAIAQSKKTIELAPEHFYAHWILGITYGAAGRYGEALEALENSSRLTGGNQAFLAEIGRLHAAAGEREKALELLAELEEQSRTEYVSPINFAKIYTGLGEKEKVYEYLEKAYLEHSFRLSFSFIADPALEVYRHDPKFRELFEKIGMWWGDTGEGYLPTDELAEAPTVTLKRQTDDSDGERETEPAAADGPEKNRSKAKPNRLLIVLLGLLVIAAGIFGYVYLSGGSQQIDSIAVMPFVNESGNAEFEYLSDGMTETLINSLSAIPNLNVKARSSVFRYKGQKTDPRKIGRELNVGAILNGRIVRRGDRVTLFLELIDTRTENNLWGKTYERKDSELVNLQTDIARDVTKNLRSRLSGAVEQLVTKEYTVNPEAYQLYLKGRFFWNKRTDDEIKRSIEFYKQALEKDPNYALAYAGIAQSYVVYSEQDVPAGQTKALARPAAMRALEIDDSVAEAHSALGMYLLIYAWNQEAAEREMKRAIELSPNYATAYQWLAIIYQSAGRNGEMLAAGKRAVELDPLSPIIAADHGVNLYVARRYDDAIAQFKKALVLDPDYFYTRFPLAKAYHSKGMYREAIAECRKLLEKGEDEEVKALLARSLAKSGERGEAVKILAGLRSESSRRFVQPWNFAQIYAALGEMDEAFEWLDKAVDVRSSMMIFLTGPSFDDFRDDPRFRNVERRIRADKLD